MSTTLTIFAKFFSSEIPIYKETTTDTGTVVSGQGSKANDNIMKSIIVLCALIVVVYSRPETYDTRYDDFDVDTLVENTRLLKSYGHCFLGKGPCTPEGSDFKKTIPDALKTSCAKCSPKQRKLIRTVVVAFENKTPDLWAELVKKEDPNGQYKESFNKFINSKD